MPIDPQMSLTYDKRIPYKVYWDPSSRTHPVFWNDILLAETPNRPRAKTLCKITDLVMLSFTVEDLSDHHLDKLRKFLTFCARLDLYMVDLYAKIEQYTCLLQKSVRYWEQGLEFIQRDLEA